VLATASVILLARDGKFSIHLLAEDIIDAGAHEPNGAAAAGALADIGHAKRSRYCLCTGHLIFSAMQKDPTRLQICSKHKDTDLK
jgi:hypothetical protein